MDGPQIRLDCAEEKISSLCQVTNYLTAIQPVVYWPFDCCHGNCVATLDEFYPRRSCTMSAVSWAPSLLEHIRNPEFSPSVSTISKSLRISQLAYTQTMTFDNVTAQTHMYQCALTAFALLTKCQDSGSHYFKHTKPRQMWFTPSSYFTPYLCSWESGRRMKMVFAK